LWELRNNIPKNNPTALPVFQKHGECLFEKLPWYLLLEWVQVAREQQRARFEGRIFFISDGCMIEVRNTDGMVGKQIAYSFANRLAVK
jgi:hypothetical protein